MACVGLCFLVAGGAALYFGARELQDYLNRDQLPEAGVDVPAYRSTTFQISAAAPSPELDGTLELDVTSRAFRFVGTVAGRGGRGGEPRRCPGVPAVR